MAYLLKLGFRQFSLAVDRLRNLVQSFVEQMAGWRSELYVAHSHADRGLSYSIQCALDQAEQDGTPFDAVLDVLDDTYFQFPPHVVPAGASFLLTSSFDPAVDRSKDWCLGRPNPGDGTARSYLSKVLDAVDPDARIVTGDYCFRDARLFRQALPLGRSGERATGEFHQVLEHHQAIDPLLCVPCQNWFDCGHLENLLRTEEKLVPERCLNRISRDALRGVITKRSSSEAKLRDEIAYYEALPASLRCLFPRVLEADPRTPSVSMEFYGYPSLSDCLVFDSFSWPHLGADLPQAACRRAPVSGRAGRERPRGWVPGELPEHVLRQDPDPHGPARGSKSDLEPFAEHGLRRQR